LDDTALLKGQFHLSKRSLGQPRKKEDILVLKIQHVGTDRKPTEEDRNEPAPLEEQLNIATL
jgi:hypothetical protein